MLLPVNNSLAKTPVLFIFKGGEIAAILNKKNWCTSSIGKQASWSPFLISNIETILSSNNPLVFLWGKQNFCFYNDAFYQNFESVLNGTQHLGEPANLSLPFIWPAIKTIVDEVVKTGEIITSPPATLPQMVKDIANDIQYGFTVMPLNDIASGTSGILISCNEIHLNKKVKPLFNMPALKTNQAIITPAAKTSKRYISVFEEAFLQLAMRHSGGHIILSGPQFIIEMVNDAYLKIAGKTMEDLVGKAFFKTIHLPNDNLAIKLTEVLQTGAAYILNEVPHTITDAGSIKTLYLNYNYEPLKNHQGNICGIICIVNNVTQQVVTKFTITENDKQFRQMLMQSPLAIVIFKGSNFVIETVNKQMLTKFWQREEEAVVGKPFLEVFPEMTHQKYPALLTRIFKTGETLHDAETKIELNTPTGKNTFYVDATYSPLLNKHGGVTGIMVAANDVTLTVKTREMLKLQETQLLLAADANKQANYEMDLLSGNLTHCKNLTKMYGVSPSINLTAQEINTFFHPDDRVDIVEKACTISHITGVLVFDARVIWPDKTVHWIRTHARMLYSPNNVPYKMVGTVMDITVEKEKDEYIMKLAAIVESSIDAIVSTRLDGSIATWNDAAVNLFGYTASEMIGKPYALLFTTGDVPVNNFNPANKLQQKISFETIFTKKDASIIDISCTVSPIKNGSGQIIGNSKIIRDITRQKLIHNQIITSEARFKLLAEDMPQLIWTSNNVGVVDYFNPAIQGFTGVSNEEIQKTGWLQLVHPDDREANLKKWIAVVATGSVLTVEHRLLKHDGEYIWHLTRAVPQRDAAGKILSWVGNCTDIHEIKENDQNRDFFISMASHELNTPVTTIKGYVEMLLEEYGNNGDQFFKKSMTNVHKQIKVLINLISDLLDLSKIKAGVVELYKEHFYSSDFINEIIKNLQAIHPDYTFCLQCKEPVILFADREKINRVLINILTNAIKYSPHNKMININCMVDDDQVVISVQDFGIGISKINQQKIFQRFFRISGKSEKTYPGFGIGLFIAAEIIDKHQGKITLESVPGEGSVFSFSLPVTKILN